MDVNHFLPEDVGRAFNETYCIADRLFVLREALTTGDYQMASVATEDVARSFRELEAMKKKKQKQDKLNEILHQLATQGVTIDLIRRYSQ